jgi:hypothetical protein
MLSRCLLLINISQYLQFLTLDVAISLEESGDNAMRVEQRNNFGVTNSLDRVRSSLRIGEIYHRGLTIMATDCASRISKDIQASFSPSLK